MKKLFSGIQPSGEIHIGNYVGALKQWVDLQDKYDSIFCVVDYHAITVDYDPKSMAQKSLDAAKDLIAVGIDPKKSTLFVQSHRPEHTELAWILNTITTMGELKRMRQYHSKAKIDSERLTKFKKILFSSKLIEKDPNSDIHWKIKIPDGLDKFLIDIMVGLESNARVGLFDYPVLQAADILIYKAKAVPVGEDQVQHIELARTLARRFNNKFAKLFPEPKPIITEGARVLGLDGKGKMSKSNAPGSYIGINDKQEDIKSKVGSATTDDGQKNTSISAGTKNLIGLIGVFAGKETEEKYMKERKAGTIKYSEFKPALAEAIIKTLEPIQKRRAELSDDEVKKILSDGAKKLEVPAKETIKEVKSALGLT